ncbi:MAG: ABC transporter permease [Aeromicrobium sp.]|nr:MAG: ABC transporter permease [Aeromicrobium sp.]
MPVDASRLEAQGLSRVGGRPPYFSYMREVFQRRDFIVSLARYRIEAENQRNRLGVGWVLLKPILNALVFGLVFGILMKSHADTPFFIEFLLIGVFLFEFFSGSLGAGSKSITSNSALVQSLSFPRMSLPISVVTQKFFQLVPTMALLIIALVVMGHRPQLEWLLLIPLLALFYVFCLGMVLIVARLTVHVRDLANLIPFLTRFVFYTTGIFFSFDVRFADHPELLEIVQYQPVYAILSLGRSILLNSDPLYTMDPTLWWITGAWSIGLLVIGSVFFWRAEERYGRVF